MFLSVLGAGFDSQQYTRVVLFVYLLCSPRIVYGAVKPLEANPDAKRLYDDLLSNYNRLIRPVANNTETLTVYLGLKLSNLFELNLKSQVMTTNMWVLQKWVDYKLRWDPADYGGVEKLYVPSEHIWLPDIVLFNNADGNYEVTLMTKATVKYTGEVLWTPPAIYKSSCKIDVLYFPFDQQSCNMRFGSWTYNGFQVDLKHMDQKPGSNIVPVGINLSEFYLSVEWDILRVPAIRNEEYYPCCKEPFSDIVFNLTMRRKTLFYTVNLIIPCVGITFLTVLVYYLPADSGEKVSLCSSILVSLTVFFLLLAEIIPPTSLAVPLLGKYLLFTMIIVSLSICVTVGVLNIHFRGPSTHTMGPCMRKIFLHIMPKILFMRRPPYNPGDIFFRDDVAEGDGYIDGDYRDSIDFCGDIKDGSKDCLNYDCSNFKSGFNEDHDHRTRASVADAENVIPRQLTPEILSAFEGVRFIAQHIKDADKDNEIVEDWKYVSMVLDRFFLCIFTAACVLGTCGIIFQAPSLYDDTPPIDIQLTRITQHGISIAPTTPTTMLST